MLGLIGGLQDVIYEEQQFTWGISGRWLIGVGRHVRADWKISLRVIHFLLELVLLIDLFLKPGARLAKSFCMFCMSTSSFLRDLSRLICLSCMSLKNFRAPVTLGQHAVQKNIILGGESLSRLRQKLMHIDCVPTDSRIHIINHCHQSIFHK